MLVGGDEFIGNSSWGVRIPAPVGLEADLIPMVRRLRVPLRTFTAGIQPAIRGMYFRG